MAKLEVNNFSCLASISVDLEGITVIIGEQGSGKSVLTKLNYFCSDLTNVFIRYAERGYTYNRFVESVEQKFCQWFPPTAWGQHRFNIKYTSGAFTVRFLRKLSNGELSNSLNIQFSDWFQDVYRIALSNYSERDSSYEGVGDPVFASMEKDYKIRQIIRGLVFDGIGASGAESQLFIPAGRAFFTTIGRMVASIESSTLDPLAGEFAKYFAELRDIRMRLKAPLFRFEQHGNQSLSSSFMETVFRGEIFSDGEIEAVKTKDGRVVPFSALSSGQQELLPIWYTLDNIIAEDTRKQRRNNRSKISHSMTYIEEPEAHLFPAAQAALLDLLVSIFNGSKQRRSLVLTTHSPYILMRLNVLLKAGRIERSLKDKTNLHKLVPSTAILKSKSVSAYRLHEGRLEDILDRGFSLIDTGFIDEISSESSRIYDDLLDLEYGE